MKPFALLLPFLLLVGQTDRNLSDPKKVCLTTNERQLYNLLMAYRAQKKLPTIPLSAKLSLVAQAHARDLSENHNPTDTKCNLHSWSKKGKWKACCYTNDHKEATCMWNKPREIAGYESNGYEISYYSERGATAEEGLKGWKVSPGHNQVIINEGIWKKVQWNAIGIGLYKEYGVVWFGELTDTLNTIPVCD
jgi:uncharacterized protein YkwD